MRGQTTCTLVPCNTGPTVLSRESDSTTQGGASVRPSVGDVAGDVAGNHGKLINLRLPSVATSHARLLLFPCFRRRAAFSSLLIQFIIIRP